MYAVGHVKRNPETGAIAVRTIHGDEIPQLSRLAWQIATVNVGGRSAFTSDVEDWDDLYIPEPEETE